MKELAGEVDRAYTEHLRPSCSFVLSFRPLARLPISPELQSLLGSVLPPGVVRMLSACDLPAVLPTGESLARPRSATLIVELFERPLNEIKQTCFVITARTSAENDGRKRRCTVTDSERAREEMIRKPASTRLAQKLLLLVLSSSLARLRKYGFRQVWIAPATLANLRLRTALPLHRTFPSPPLSLLVTAWRKISSQAEFPAARPDHAVATRLARFIAPVLTSRTELAKEGLRNASAGVNPRLVHGELSRLLFVFSTELSRSCRLGSLPSIQPPQILEPNEDIIFLRFFVSTQPRISK